MFSDSDNDSDKDSDEEDDSSDASGSDADSAEVLAAAGARGVKGKTSAAAAAAQKKSHKLKKSKDSDEESGSEGDSEKVSVKKVCTPARARIFHSVCWWWAVSEIVLVLIVMFRARHLPNPARVVRLGPILLALHRQRVTRHRYCQQASLKTTAVTRVQMTTSIRKCA